jgi:deazaflavin-dependent oxidoreductase (nitroreductase family)
MPADIDALKDQLSEADEIELTVTGRKSGRPSTRPVWFVLEGDQLYLVPVKGSDTEWYKNVLKNPKIRIEADDAKAELKATPTTDAAQVKAIVEKFRKKYGAEDVKKYYSKFDAALGAQLP